MKIIYYILSLIILLVSCNSNTAKRNVNSFNLIGTDIPTVVPSEIGIDSLLLRNINTKIISQEYPNIHSVLISKSGKLIYEHYFEGSDQIFGHDIGTVKFTDTTLHDIRSITKSIISACVGIAIKEGYIKNVDQNISDFFPNMDSIFRGDKANWTIENFLTMTTGLSWNENVPYNNPENDEIQMTYKVDPIRYVLEKQLDTIPGKKFNYNGGATQVLAEIIERSSNTSLDKFVKNHLLIPLGIEHYQWTKYSVWGGSDKFAAAGGLRLTSRDLMKFGLLYRNKGMWNKKQVIPKDWISESFDPKIEYPSEVTEGIEWYGYQFWIWPDQFQDDEFIMNAALGNGDQNIFWDLKNDVIIVTTAGNYNKWDISNDSYTLLKEHIYPLVLNINSR